MKITTHALDVYSGKPAKGLKVEAYFISDKRNLIKSITLNDDGRSDAPIVDKIKVGNYELVFHVGTYFKEIIQLKKSAFLEKVPVNFFVSNENENFHVPLLFSTFSYTTYKGS